MGYYQGLSHHELMPYLKGLTTLHHFFIHYSVGIFFGILLGIAALYVNKKRPNLPLLLTLAVLISHAPDLRFVYRKLPHDHWEVVFLGHTAVDEVPDLIWLWVPGCIVLAFTYKRLLAVLQTRA